VAVFRFSALWLHLPFGAASGSEEGPEAFRSTAVAAGVCEAQSIVEIDVPRSRDVEFMSGSATYAMKGNPA
jgi:hypothetical protein